MHDLTTTSQSPMIQQNHFFALVLNNIAEHAYVLIPGLIVLLIFIYLVLSGKLSKFGFGSFSAEIKDQKALIQNQGNTSAERLLDAYSGPLVAKEKEALIERLKAQNLKSDAERFDFLVTSFADTIIGYRFEMLDSVLWGAQISLLDFINGQAGTYPISALNDWYQSTVQTPINSRYKEMAFEEFFAFLVDRELLGRKRAGVGINENLEVTITGKAFLIYLTHRQLTRYKDPF